MYVMEEKAEKKIEIPSEPIAVPINLLSFFYDETKQVVVINKTPIVLKAEAGARHIARVKFPLLPRGGIKVFPVKKEKEKKEEKEVKVIAERRLKYGTIFVKYDPWWKKYIVEGEGYLVFKPLNEREMKLTIEEPKYILLQFINRVDSRSDYARLKVHGATWYKIDETQTKITTYAIALALVEVGKAIIVGFYKAPYRGYYENPWYVLTYTPHLKEAKIEIEEKSIGWFENFEDALTTLGEEEII